MLENVFAMKNLEDKAFFEFKKTELKYQPIFYSFKIKEIFKIWEYKEKKTKTKNRKVISR